MAADRGRISPDSGDVEAVDHHLIEKAHMSHVGMLRAARVHHKAIARGLQLYFDSVTAEQVPEEFLNILKRVDQ
jgi:hypothetical protein